LDVWREACRHIEIADATDRITPLIVRQLPLDQLVLRIIDLERSAVDTVAATSRVYFNGADGENLFTTTRKPYTIACPA
jgi:hypothetical protein